MLEIVEKLLLKYEETRLFGFFLDPEILLRHHVKHITEEILATALIQMLLVVT